MISIMKHVLAAAMTICVFATAAAAAVVVAEEGGGGGGCRAEEAVFFNFGDSNSDTGGVAAGLGYHFPLPDGRAFFRRPTGRLCDGRLVVDFLCESLPTRYLSPYLEALGSDFSNGANFAVAGSTTLPNNVPFALRIQVQQFLHFRSRSLELSAQGFGATVDEDGFGRALYSIDIGQNDLTGIVGSRLPYDQMIARIPPVVGEIRSAVTTLYNTGARNFWIHNTGPLGCLPEKLAAPRKDDSDLDAYGCLKTANDVAREFNSQLSTICDEMRSELRNSTIVYTDIFAIKYDLIANYTSYGFEKPLTACCGYGGPPYNYNRSVTCLNPACQVCDDGAKYISWDGVHYTEAANSAVANKILTAEYSNPRTEFGFFCSTT
ncbi:GDSL esterase/lipase At1g09390-like [Ananas comosus]|uniref:GDSL esterase/lipase At1g09390-like n=1 Tax=Ananas comosus TaxID=4615 RepID=A0A6P5G6H6_ANACO|nr:GDSL esterase/lipase At1g09390-like [Ananas comosus]